MYDIFFAINKNDSKKKEEILLRFPQARFCLSDFNTSQYDLISYARDLAKTDFFWFIDHDVDIVENFIFEYNVMKWFSNHVHIFKEFKTGKHAGCYLIPTNYKFTYDEAAKMSFLTSIYVDDIAVYLREFDIFFASYPDKKIDDAILKKYPSAKVVKIDEDGNSFNALKTAQMLSTTHVFWYVDCNCTLVDDFRPEYFVPKYHEKYVHVFQEKYSQEHYGVYLISTRYDIKPHEAIDMIFDEKMAVDSIECESNNELFFALPNNLIIRNEIISQYPTAKILTVDNNNSLYDAIKLAQTLSKTRMFWFIHQDYKVLDDFKFDFSVIRYDEKYVHVFKDKVSDKFGGAYLISKHYDVTKHETDPFVFKDKKHISIYAVNLSIKFDTFTANSYEEFLRCQDACTTQMFWLLSDHFQIYDNFNFNIPASIYDRNIVHIFKNGNFFDGVCLIPKSKKISKREFENRFFIKKIEVDITASMPSMFDIVFISYEEPNADQNYQNLLKKFPHAKRVHGVKGIHQAHKHAASLVSTDMFWVVDGDAEILDDFNFDYQVPKWDFDVVHVCRSQNPINDLTYGYGGVKLLPTALTANLIPTSVDMTTSISKKFSAIPITSNISKFNTDEFNTWRSAFRECVKLSSKVITNQKDDETNNRLDIWCNIGIDRPFGKYAIEGAKLGRQYGNAFKDNPEMLKKINDWQWLKDEFDRFVLSQI